jgi:uncharacterized lipoprotein
MKNLSFLVIAALFMGGCAYKNEAVDLSSYHSQYTGNSSQAHKNIYLVSVSDVRENKTSVGYVQANKKVVTKLYSYTDFASKYQEGLNTALKMAQFNVQKEPMQDALHVDVKIKKIELVYNDTNKLDENLRGQVVIEVTTTLKDKVVIQTFTQDQGIWIQPSYNSKDVEPLLYKLFAGSINDIVAKLTSF